MRFGGKSQRQIFYDKVTEIAEYEEKKFNSIKEEY